MRSSIRDPCVVIIRKKVSDGGFIKCRDDMNIVSIPPKIYKILDTILANVYALLIYFK